MVVSMDTDANDDMIGSGAHTQADDEGFTGIASASSQTSSNVNCISTESTEADTTYENYYVMKNTVEDEKSQAVACESHNEGDLFSKQLKELINLQLDLIEYQQSKITSKDKQIMLLKSEKEQLEARICRMERRIALQKRQVEPGDENQITKGKTGSKSSSTTTPAATPTSSIKTEFQRYECHLPVTVTSRNDRDFKYTTYLRTNLNYLDLTETKLLPKIEQPLLKKLKKEEKCVSVSVPSWKLLGKTYTQIKDPPEEDASNEAFLRRHLKPELEEKRRKRWDLQHLRAQQQHQHLAHKEKNKDTHHKKSASTFDENCSSLFPNADNVMAIEINNMVPVCVFGYPAPAVTVKELELPWFSIAKREIQLRQAKEKMMKKTMSSKRAYGPHAKKKHPKIK